jgi:thiamine phosphate synthase YjbQ (UPF0047 family)
MTPEQVRECMSEYDVDNGTLHVQSMHPCTARVLLSFEPEAREKKLIHGSCLAS